jgi:hypothetical protein
MYGVIDERNNKRQDWLESDGEAWITNDKNHIFGLVKGKIYNLKTGAVVAEEDKEKRNDMTEFGFENARSNTPAFCTGLKNKITQLLK